MDNNFTIPDLEQAIFHIEMISDCKCMCLLIFHFYLLYSISIIHWARMTFEFFNIFEVCDKFELLCVCFETNDIYQWNIIIWLWISHMKTFLPVCVHCNALMNRTGEVGLLVWFAKHVNHYM